MDGNNSRLPRCISTAFIRMSESFSGPGTRNRLINPSGLFATLPFSGTITGRSYQHGLRFGGRGCTVNGPRLSGFGLVPGWTLAALETDGLAFRGRPTRCQGHVLKSGNERLY